MVSCLYLHNAYSLSYDDTPLTLSLSLFLLTHIDISTVYIDFTFLAAQLPPGGNQVGQMT